MTFPFIIKGRCLTFHRRQLGLLQSRYKDPILHNLESTVTQRCQSPHRGKALVAKVPVPRHLTIPLGAVGTHLLAHVHDAPLVLLGGKVPKSRRVPEAGHGGGGGNDSAPADHGEELEHAVGHVGGLEGEGHERGEAGVPLGLGSARLVEGLVEGLDGLYAMRECLGGVVRVGGGSEIKMGGCEAKHSMDEEVELEDR